MEDREGGGLSDLGFEESVGVHLSVRSQGKTGPFTLHQGFSLGLGPKYYLVKLMKKFDPTALQVFLG